ncbi:MAG: DUF1080 domain-containing protein [Bacteroidia bacterium]|nr:DUF1080 domain-containing protein [Bacteroidia bacterium]
MVISCSTARMIFKENSADWEVFGDADWNFSNNELVGKVTDGAGFVMTRQSYKDFVLELEFNPDSTINSGVFIRCKNKDINPMDCYELNIWDLHPDQDNRTGAIVMRKVPTAIVETINKWNTYRIQAEKNRITVWINNILTADIRDDSLTNGFIGLQATGSGTIRFRNVKIKAMALN